MPPRKYPISSETRIKISSETRIKFDEIHQLQTLRNVYAKIPFTHKRAVKTAKEIAKTRHVFWQMVEDEVPELKDCAITYDEKTGTVHKIHA